MHEFLRKSARRITNKDLTIEYNHQSKMNDQYSDKDV